MTTRVDPDLAKLEVAIEEIWEIAQRMGLRPFATHFEVVPSEIMYEFGSYGMPGRFSHWTHGKIYHMQKTMHDYGLSKIYELVINTDPCWAFLLDSNTLLENMFVVAHVLGHSDFFAQNAYFQRTSRRMLDTMKLNADRLRAYEFEHGLKAVERTLDAALAIQEHIDPNAVLKAEEARLATRPHTVYDDLFAADEQPVAEATVQPGRRGVQLPQPDLLLFLARESPTLAEWQRDVVQVVRNEMLYFFPQMQTKIINEGWASYWHVQIMRELELSGDDHLRFAQLHSGVVSPQPGRLNPYYLGYRLLTDIERRYNELDGSGREQLFQVRETENDVSLIRNYLTKDIVDELNLYYAERQGDELIVTETDWEQVRDRLVNQLVDHGIPAIQVEDGDYQGNSELLLRHVWSGQPLDLGYAHKTLEGIHSLWGRKVWLETRTADEKTILLSYTPDDGHQQQDG